jgi:hypothetical protein
LSSTGGDVPPALRLWFVVHFWADIVFAVPLLVAPAALLGLLGWECVDLVSARLVGAALIGIGVESLLGRNGSRDSFRTMLRLKVLWSSTATVGIAVSLLQGAPAAAWLFLAIFGGFCGLWSSWAWRLRSAG